MRIKKIKCHECGYFQSTGEEYGFGECRMSAPEISGWPAVEADDWCADFEKNEEEEDIDERN